MKKDELTALVKAFQTNKSEDDFIRDGAAMQRLAQNPDFQILQRLWAEAKAQLTLTIANLPKEDLLGIQGAFKHHDALTRLPMKVLEIASSLIAERRERTENEMGIDGR